MPNLTFVLPHWLYWTGLVVFPLVAIYMASRPSARAAIGRPTLGVGYLTLVTAGFVGLHRFYVRSVWGLVYLFPFVGVLAANIMGRSARLELSKANNDRLGASFKVETFEARSRPARKGRRRSWRRRGPRWPALRPNSATRWRRFRLGTLSPAGWRW